MSIAIPSPFIWDESFDVKDDHLNDQHKKLFTMISDLDPLFASRSLEIVNHFLYGSLKRSAQKIIFEAFTLRIFVDTPLQIFCPFPFVLLNQSGSNRLCASGPW